MENGSLIFGNISPLCQEQLYINFAQPQSSHDNINISLYIFFIIIIMASSPLESNWQAWIVADLIAI